MSCSSERPRAYFFCLFFQKHSSKPGVNVRMVKGVFFSMTNEQKERITALRRTGHGYKMIATSLGLPADTVKSWCRRHPAEDTESDTVCLQCGKTISQTPHKRKRKFCSDICRNRWWSAHPEESDKGYLHTCLFCGKKFKNARRIAGYCGRDCFAKARASHD